jgi:hypothetical protein
MLKHTVVKHVKLRSATVLCCGLSLSSAAYGAVVTLDLVLDPTVPGCTGCTLSGPGTWNVFARASIGDNFGIARYQVAIRGVNFLIHRSPRTVVDPEETADPAGFTLLRSLNGQDVTVGGFDFHASQDTVTPSNYLVRGFGQETSSFALEIPGHTFGSPQTQTSWNAALFLTEGRYAEGATPFINFDLTTVGVFSESTGTLTEAALVGPPELETNDPPVVADGLIDNVMAGHPNSANNPVVHTFTATDDEPVSELVWGGLAFDSYTPGFGGTGGAPWKPAAFDSDTQIFSWDTTGSPRGIYKWNVNATDMNGVGWVDQGTVTVNVVGPLPGDYNRDGTVDAADYTIWRNDGPGNFIEPYTRSDENGNGFVDNLDYGTWKGHFGDSLNGAGAGARSANGVPEPCTFAVLILMLVVLTTVRRRLR